MSQLKYLIAVTLGLTGTACLAGDPIAVGSPAPAMKVAKWVKGKPIKAFEKGKVYVVEFWATWCGPCKTSIPHLTEMAKHFKGKASFTGVSVWEEENPTTDAYQQKVVDFVKEMGDTMDYNVAVDDRQGTMAKTWMTAANQKGIPAAFVVGKDGKIAWIGHPMDGLDKVVEAVIDDQFDPKAAAQTSGTEEAMTNLFKGIEAKVAKDDLKGALVDIDTAIANHPEMAGALASMKFSLLLGSDEAAAYAYGKKLAAEDSKTESMILNNMAWSIVDDLAKLKHPDYDTAIVMAEAAMKRGGEKNAYVLGTLAYAHFKKGNIDKAIALQEKAVAMLKADKTIPAETVKEITDRLEMFKKKKGSG